jgi:hypothetical protein
MHPWASRAHPIETRAYVIGKNLRRISSANQLGPPE